MTKKILGLVTVEKSIANFLIIQLVEKRKKLGLSQRDLAKLTGIKQPTIAKIEKGRITPRLDTFLKLTQALNIYVKLVDIKVL